MKTKTANITTRVEPEIKEQAEAVLNQLGISMSTAMTIYLRQIALQRKIPFEAALPSPNIRSLSEMSQSEVDEILEECFADIEAGRTRPLKEFMEELKAKGML